MLICRLINTRDWSLVIQRSQAMGPSQNYSRRFFIRVNTARTENNVRIIHQKSVWEMQLAGHPIMRYSRDRMFSSRLVPSPDDVSL